MQYLDNEAQDALLQRLVRGTLNDRYAWAQDADDQYSFVLVAGRFGFVLESRDRDDFAPFELHIFDRAGTPVELQSIVTTSYRPDTSDLLADLYSTVKRRTLHLDTVADDIFSALDSLEGEN